MRLLLSIVAGLVLAAACSGPTPQTISPSQCATLCGSKGVCEYRDDGYQAQGLCVCREDDGYCPVLEDAGAP